MGAIELNDPEKKATIERIKSFFNEIEVYITNIEKGNIIFPIGRVERIRDLFKPINRESCKAILDTYKSSDILAIICDLVSSKLIHDNLVERIANKEKVGKVFISTGYLSKLLPESELTELANLILDRIINPQIYHTLILLPKVELADSLKINEAYFLIKADSNIACNFWTNYPENSEDEEAITIGENKTYLLIKQEGCISGFLGKKALSLDLIEGKLKVILGLSLGSTQK